MSEKKDTKGETSAKREGGIKPSNKGGALSVLVDGAALPEDEARALWNEFSLHMDEHRGDLAGFAAKKGFKSIRPEPRGGKAVLVVTTIKH